MSAFRESRGGKMLVKISGSVSWRTVERLTKWLVERGYSVESDWCGASKSTITATICRPPAFLREHGEGGEDD